MKSSVRIDACQASETTSDLRTGQQTHALRVLLLMALCAGCALDAPFTDAQYDAAAGTVSEVTLSRRLDDLAADSMLGRGPGQRGDTIAVGYLEQQMRAIGLSPGGPYGFLQPVRLGTLRATGTATFLAGGRVVLLDPSLVIPAATQVGTHTVADAPLVFVGYGIVAPEHGRDDYAGADLRGKVALILDGEPAVVSGRRFGTLGGQSAHAFNFLKGRHALARGAAGVVFVRRGVDSVHRNRRHLLQHTMSGAVPDVMPDAPITIHVSASAAATLASAAGSSIAAWTAMAEDSSFRPVEVPLRLDASVTATRTPFTSHNVVGVVRGSDPVLRDECVVFLGHWDGYGIGPPVDGDSIYNGALDDAAGVSAMLLIAEATLALPRAPRRTMVFVATTAEERGMLGASAYAADPVCPLKQTALAVGMDWSWVWGLTDTIVSNGIGYSTVDSAAREVAARHGKAFAPGLGEYWLASDHAVLALRGVPSWFGGLDGAVIGKPAGWGAAQLETQRTHVPSDERKPDWNLSGALFEVRYLFELGTRVAESDTRLIWTVPSEFKRARATP